MCLVYSISETRIQTCEFQHYEREHDVREKDRVTFTFRAVQNPYAVGMPYTSWPNPMSNEQRTGAFKTLPRERQFRAGVFSPAQLNETFDFWRLLAPSKRRALLAFSTVCFVWDREDIVACAARLTPSHARSG